MGLFSSIGSIAGGLLGSIIPGVGTAIGSGLGGALGGAIDGSKQKKTNNTAITNATAAQNAGINNAIAGNNAGLATSASQFAPYMMAGQQALGQQGDLLGLNGGAQQQTSIDALRASPLYQSLFGNGQNTILANASATGGLRGGNTQNSLANFGRDTLAQVLQQHLGNLGGLSQQGLTATGGIASLRNNNSAINAGLLTDQGNNNAQGIYGQAATNTAGNNAIGSALGGIDIGGLLGSIFGGGGGSGFNSAGLDPSSIAGKLPF